MLKAAPPTRLQAALPFLHWPRPTPRSLRDDLIAGLTVALLVVPQSLAYAQLAGVPAYHGLYAALLPAVVGVLFGSSALLSTGPVALTSLLTAASVSTLAAPGTGAFVANVMLLALLSGLIQVGLGLARAGVLLNLLSRPVLVGFINAAALVIALSQLPALLGLKVSPEGGIAAATWRLLGQATSAHGLTLACGGLALALLLLFKRFAPRWPGVLLMAVFITLLSQFSGYAAAGGAVVGRIPEGLPGLAWPAMSWTALLALLPAAFVVALVSFAEAMASCKVIAAKTRTPWNENQELIGQGLAKVVAAFCQAMPVSGSFSRSALYLASPARSGLAPLFSAACVLAVLLWFTPLLHHLPQAALAAMIIMAVVNLIDLRALRNAWQAHRDDGLAALLTFGATLAFAPAIQNGILVGIVFSLAAFIYRRMLPRFELQLLDAKGVLHPADAAHASALPPPVAGVLRFDAALFFANAWVFEAALLRLEREHPGLKVIVLRAQGINLLDATGVDVLRALLRQLRERGVALVLSNAKPQFLSVARRTGLLAEFGAGAVFDSDEQAFAAVRAAALTPRCAPA